MEVLDLLDQYQIPYIRQGKDVRHGFVGLACPFCHHSGHYLGINVAKSYATCWSCGPHSIADVIATIAGVKLGAAIEATRHLQRGGRVMGARPPGALRPPAGVGPLLPAHRKYLAGRGFDPDKLVALWGLGGIGLDGGRFAWRLFVPVHANGEVVSWTTRAIGDVPKRYHGAGLDEERLPAKSLLYGADYAGAAVAVVEGPADVWAIGPGAVSTFGVGYSSAQLRALASYPVRYVVFDNETEAQKRAGALAGLLAAFPGRTANVRLSGKDPGASVGSAELDELRAMLI